MLVRIFAGLLGLLFTIFALVNIFDGSFEFTEGRYGWLMPFLGIAFIVYAIGGQSLLRKHFPIWAERQEKLSNKKNENDLQS